MIEIRELWPCIDAPGLSVFTITADQRYSLGRDTFLETHHPITMCRFPVDRSPEIVREDALLRRLLNTKGLRPGNRVFILYGAAGSGKSELMRWLQVMLARDDPARAEVTVRIPRTELNLLSITESFHHMLSGRYFEAATHQRWEKAREKPRTLTKLLLLTALERCLESDEEINALYFRLLAWVEPRVTQGLASVITSQASSSDLVELLTREDLQDLREETSLPVALDYEQFRYHLTEAFRDHLLEGVYLPSTLQRISADLEKQGRRPILLVDDLVQSVNLFATDLLDTFITLDSGTWDVVVGLTPAALSSNDRGRELLDRISYLDTVDDRVEKLWLSDMQGDDSYFLSEDSCSTFAARYLDAYRALNGWRCTSCEHRLRCAGLGTCDGILLAPFNVAVIGRLFRGLPWGKGKARQLLNRLHTVLAAANDDQGLLSTLAEYAQLDFAAEAEDSNLAHLAELYGYTEGSSCVTLSAEVVAAFGLQPHELELPAVSLRNREASSIPDPGAMDLTDPGRSAIKAWLDGKEVNRQSLLPLRRGIARWLGSILPVQGLHSPGVARPHNVLQWRRVYLSVRPPIILEGMDEGEGIPVTRQIGLAAFHLHDYAIVTGVEKSSIIAKLAQDVRLVPLQFSALEYQNQVLMKLQNQVGMPHTELSLVLYTWLLVAEGVPDSRPPGFGDHFWAEAQSLNGRLSYLVKSVDEELGRAVSQLFEDSFGLRRNVYDGGTIAHLTMGRGPQELLDLLCQLDLERVDRYFYLGNKPLAEVLGKLQDSVRHWKLSVDEGTLSADTREVLKALTAEGAPTVPMSQVSASVWSELEATMPDVYARLRVNLADERV